MQILNNMNIALPVFFEDHMTENLCLGVLIREKLKYVRALTLIYCIATQINVQLLPVIVL